ncbi:MAG: PD-(D/E)XK nuclease family protein [Candidatus Dojkabacteria bacterium]|nr:PD-(D/E)XK nuclease family protein [Candidatus Dojkabacteria bacterium]
MYFTFAKEYESYGSVSEVSPVQYISKLLETDLLDVKSVDTNDIEFEVDDFTKILLPTDSAIYNKDEEEYLKEKIKNLKLSPSSLNTYLDSPLKFKDRFLLRVPELKSKELALGTAVHAAFEKFNINLIKNSDVYPTLDSMNEWFESALQKEFSGFSEYEETLIEGKRVINEYYDFYIKTGSYSIPVLAEYNFGARNIYLTKEGNEPISLTGKIDKVEIMDKDQNIVKITDYKTSKPKSENEILGNTKSSDGSYYRQLVFYKLLFDLDPNFKPEEKFNSSKYILGEAEIDFLRSDRKKYVKRGFNIASNDVEDLKTLIIEVMSRIRNLEFPEDCNINI